MSLGNLRANGVGSLDVGIAVLPASVQRVRVEGVVYRRLKNASQPLNLASRRGDASSVVRQFVRLAKRTTNGSVWRLARLLRAFAAGREHPHPDCRSWPFSAVFRYTQYVRSLSLRVHVVSCFVKRRRFDEPGRRAPHGRGTQANLACHAANNS